MTSHDELLKIPGVAERSGREVIEHCGPELRDRPLAVLASVRQALLARRWSADVAYFAHTHRLSDAERAELAARGVRVVEGRVQRLVIVGDRLAGIELDWASVVAPAAILVEPAPFSSRWENQATEVVLGTRRHGLESLV